MSDIFLSLGTVVIFSIVLPGVLLTGVSLPIDNTLKSENPTYLAFYSITLGFAANIAGHFTGIIFRKIFPKYNGVPFENIYLCSYNMTSETVNFMRKDTEFWFSVYCLYWNTALGIPIVTLINIDQFLNKPLYAGSLIVGFSILIYLSKKTLDGLLHLSSIGEDKTNNTILPRCPLNQDNVRFTKTNDIAQIAEILTHPNNAKNIWYSKDKKQFSSIILQWLRDPNLICLSTLDKNENIVGFLKLRLGKHEKRHHVGAIGPIAVHPKCWRQGYGTVLLKNGIELAKRTGQTRLELLTPADEESIQKLVTKLGFEKEGILRNALARDEGYIDAVQYSLILKSEKLPEKEIVK